MSNVFTESVSAQVVVVCGQGSSIALNILYLLRTVGSDLLDYDLNRFVTFFVCII